MRDTAARGLDRTTTRVLASHACGAVALSVPFPALVAELAERSAGPLEIGIAGASRMLPYVVLSWFVGIVADRTRRDHVVRGGLWVRLALAVAAALAVTGGRTWLAVGLCTVAVAVSLPAYPALAAGLPTLAGSRSVVAVEALVTIEVGSFVVGSALGGLLLQPGTRPWLPLVPSALTLLAILLFRRVSVAAPRSSSAAGLGRAYRTLLGSPSARGAVAVMAAINLVGAFVALALLPLAMDSWDAGAEGYGVATAVLGFAALGAPLGRVLGGRTARQALHRMMPMLAVSVLLLVPARGVMQALPALAVLGALSVGAEARATRILIRSVPDSVRATVLGINDAAIVAAAMLGTLVAPWALEATSAAVVFGVGALALLAPLLMCRPRTESEMGPSATASPTGLAAAP